MCPPPRRWMSFRARWALWAARHCRPPPPPCCCHGHPQCHTQAQAEAIIDTRLQHAGVNPSGAPRTWSNTAPGGVLSWRPDSPYMDHLCIVCERARGALAAHTPAGRHAWLAVARRLGDFLMRMLRADGAITCEWHGQHLHGEHHQHDGPSHPAAAGLVAGHPIPLLLALWRTTPSRCWPCGGHRRSTLPSGRGGFRHFSLVHMGPSCSSSTARAATPTATPTCKEPGALSPHAFVELH